MPPPLSHNSGYLGFGHDEVGPSNPLVRSVRVARSGSVVGVEGHSRAGDQDVTALLATL